MQYTQQNILRRLVMTKAHDLHSNGQSIWLDYIRRQFVKDSDGLRKVVDEGVRGVTSNPAIFMKAIANSSDYDKQMQILVGEGKSTEEIYEALAVQDIQNAADILRSVYDESDGADGFVSLEVRPELAHDTDETVREARHLWQTVDRPNLMIKVPATQAGLPAITTLIGEGINVNVTLMFSLQQYIDVANAYIEGLEKLATSGGDLSKVASVASFFVSRMDVMVDEQLDDKGKTDLKGKAGIANARVAYAKFCEIFSGDRWEKLASKGARVQRPLWASTSTKNPEYPDTLYVDSLVAEHTVNTVPPDTFDALNDHADTDIATTCDATDAQQILDQLEAAGIDYDGVTQALLDEGVEKFEKPFAELMESIDEKRKTLVTE
jgi:transaldolase